MPSMMTYVAGFALLLLIAGGGYYLASRDMSLATPEGESQTAGANVPTDPNAKTVVYGDKGFAPATTTIKLGQTVRWFNQSSKTKLWVRGTDPSTVTGLAEFDQYGSITKGQGWDFTFNKVGTFSYHNQMTPKQAGGAVIVTAK